MKKDQENLGVFNFRSKSKEAGKKDWVSKLGGEIRW